MQSSSVRAPEPQSATTILIVDDHGLIRDSLRVHLEGFAREFAVVGEAAHAEEAIGHARALCPDIILMDVDMPGLSCFDAIRTIRVHVPDQKFILFFGKDRAFHLDQAVQCQVNGYVTKHESVAFLLESFRAVRKGHPYYSPRIVRRIESRRREGLVSAKCETPLGRLSPRERELLRILAQGNSLKQAARVLGVSYKTVDNQRSSIMSKLDIHDRVRLARLAIREGLIEA